MRILLLTCLLLLSIVGLSQQEQVWLHPNRGQWHSNIRYKVELNGGEMYLENQGFTYAFHNASEIYHANHEGKSDIHSEEHLEGHAIKSSFIGSNADAEKIEKDQSLNYRNYFLGNNQSKWKSMIYSLKKVVYKEFYSGIDMQVEGNTSNLEYSFVVSPGRDVSQIQMKIEGANAVFIDNEGNLHTTHSFGEIIESAPKAWNVDENGKKYFVKVAFKLEGNVIVYSFPKDYNRNQTLVIDPELTFSTFTGSTSDNWGFSAAPDQSARVFAAGIVFGTGYPIVTGAFDPSFNGGSFDIGISKFNALGTQLLFSSYIGGLGVETPHSIVCNANNELYIMGATSSADFPMPGNPFDGSFNGGPAFTENGLTFNGSDIYVTRLSANGANLLSSTFVGGSGTDGINSSVLHYNYGDQFRGSIEIDGTGNVFVASSTASSNFPTANAFQSFLNGPQDAVIFKLSANLNSLMWSSLFGGGGVETGNSLEVAANGDVYLVGGTTSPSLGFSIGHTLNGLGGLSDGYLIKINGTTPFVQSGTYMGTNEYDQTYFVQLDLNNQVYVYGQTEGVMAISSGVYGTPNSGQFVRKYSTNLATLSWSTCIGAGTGHVEISPTAFLVSDCYEIYISGWGGSVNSGNSSATFSSSNGFQVTPDAYQSSTNGNNFYIAVLRQDAVSLKYATYMGSLTASSNHVDGGTSRFDKSGRIYHAVCGACGGNNFGFTTTTGVWSPSNPSPNCNLAVFKFELNQIEAIVSQPAPLICMPAPVIFSNNSSNGNTFFWDFGDNTTSTQVNPSHAYQGAGTYDVVLIVSDSSGCFSADTTTFQINIGDFNGQVTAPNAAICPGSTYQFDASGGSTYQWSPSQFLNNANIANPIATITETTIFTVIISDSCGSDTLSITLQVLEGGSNAAADTTICLGNSVPIFASGGSTYVWTPSLGLDNPNTATPIATPTQTTVYSCTITSASGCTFNEQVEIVVVLTPPDPQIPDSVKICSGEIEEVNVSGADIFEWSPNISISTTSGPTVSVYPDSDMYYYCDFINACGAIRDSVLIDIVAPNISAGFDTIICPGNSANLFAFGGISYVWSPANTLSENFGDQVIATPLQNTTYIVTGTDINGCSDTATVDVNLFPQAFIQTSPDEYAFFGDVIQLSATSTTTGTYVWSPSEYLSCTVCVNPVANPDKNFQYVVTYTDQNGCKASDSVRIFYDAIIYVPNTFTPQGNNFNEVFKAVGGNVKSFEMSIFNRWGELIFTMNSMDESWDGTYKGLPCQDGTYVWKIVYTDFTSNKEKKMAGHINLLR
jgi:gliding motility-associated-like protein